MWRFAVARVGEKVYIFAGKMDGLFKTDSIEIFDFDTEQLELGVKMLFSDSDFTACAL